MKAKTPPVLHLALRGSTIHTVCGRTIEEWRVYPEAEVEKVTCRRCKSSYPYSRAINQAWDRQFEVTS